MVLQIRETIVLQRVELEEKASSPPFRSFALLPAFVEKLGFAEKMKIE
jgi:hypothetical protein